MSTAAARKSKPATRSKRRIANAIANAALEWSLGNEGSCERPPQTCAEGCVSNGRDRCQSFAMSWLTSSASAAEARADADASFHFELPPGRARSHSPAAAAAYRGTAHFSKKLPARPSQECSATKTLIAW